MKGNQRPAPEQPEFDPVRLQMDLNGFASVLELLADSPSIVGEEELNALGNALRGIIHINGLDQVADEASS